MVPADDVRAVEITGEVLTAELLRKLYGIRAVIVDTDYGKIAAVTK